ncbi:MAG TPA: peptidylprolyl isomerase [Myxococcota bacterium]
MSARIAVVLPALLAVVVAASACPADPRDQKKDLLVVRFGDQEIKESELLVSLAQHGTARIADPTARNAVARAILDEMVIDRLMLAAAQKAGITVRDDEVDREVRSRAEGYPAGAFSRLLIAEQLTLPEFKQKVKDRLIEDAYLRAKLAEAPAITEAEIKARFDAEGKEQLVGEQVRARQILVRTSEEAAHVLEQIRTRKITFEAAAQKWSTAPDAADGGDLGWFSKGDMPDTFDVCFDLEKGTISDIVSSDYGFHIFQVVDRREEHPETYEAARDRLEEEIMRTRQDETYQHITNELKQGLHVQIVDAGVAHVVSLLPPAPVTPTEAPDDTQGRALDSLPTGIDPTPPVPGQKKKARED